MGNNLGKPKEETFYKGVDKELDEAFDALQLATRAKNNIWHNRGSYNYTVSVPYTHKYKVGGGGFWTKWVWKTETRYRNETRFNQQKYDNDLANATISLNQAQQNYNNHQQRIINKIQLMRQDMRSVSGEENQIQSLKCQQEALKNQLIQTNNKYYNMSQSLTLEQNKLNILQTESFTIKNHINNISNQISLVDQNINNQNTDLQSKLTILGQQETKKSIEKSKLENAIAKMSDIERAKIAYEMILSDQQELFELVAKYGFSVECLADIAFSKNNWQVFELCLEMGLDFDNYLVSENGLCLSSKILLQGNIEIINKMFDHQNGALTNTIMHACMPNNMSLIEKLYQHDKELFQKNYIGTSVLQVGIWHNNVELVQYIAKNDSKIFQNKTSNGESYFHLALTCKTDEIIKIISKNIDLKEQCLSLLQRNEFELFQIVIDHKLLSQDDLKEFLVFSTKKYQNKFAESCLAGIDDVQDLFIKSIINQDFLVIECLMKNKPSICNIEMLNNISGAYDKLSIEYQFIQEIIAEYKVRSEETLIEEVFNIESFIIEETNNKGSQSIGETFHEDN